MRHRPHVAKGLEAAIEYKPCQASPNGRNAGEQMPDSTHRVTSQNQALLKKNRSDECLSKKNGYFRLDANFIR